MLHDEHVVLPQVAESSPSRLALREGVVLHPPPTGKLVEVIARVHGLIQASHDHACHCDAWLCQTQAGVSWRRKDRTCP